MLRLWQLIAMAATDAARAEQLATLAPSQRARCAESFELFERPRDNVTDGFERAAA